MHFLEYCWISCSNRCSIEPLWLSYNGAGCTCCWRGFKQLSRSGCDTSPSAGASGELHQYSLDVFVVGVFFGHCCFASEICWRCSMIYGESLAFVWIKACPFCGWSIFPRRFRCRRRLWPLLLRQSSLSRCSVVYGESLAVVWLKTCLYAESILFKA